MHEFCMYFDERFNRTSLWIRCRECGDALRTLCLITTIIILGVLFNKGLLGIYMPDLMRILEL